MNYFFFPVGKPERLHSAIPVVDLPATGESRLSLGCWRSGEAANRLPIERLEPDAPEFTSPQFHFGQMVRTYDGLIGYISGLLFYPDTQNWEYSICPTHSNKSIVSGTLNEVWYTSKELTLDADS